MKWEKRVVLDPKLAPLSPSPTSAHAVVVGPFVYVTGQTGQKPGEASCTGDIKQQARQVVENIGAILAACGTSLENVVKRTTMIGAGGDAVVEAYEGIDKLFPSACASTTIEGPRVLVPGALIEMDVVALIPE